MRSTVLISRKSGMFLTEMEPNAPRLCMVARRPHDCDNPTVHGYTFIQSDTREALIILCKTK